MFVGVTVICAQNKCPPSCAVLFEHQFGLFEVRAIFQGRARGAVLAVSVFGTVILYLGSKRPPLTSVRFPFPRR